MKASVIAPRRIAHLRHSLGMLEARLGEAPLVQLLRTEVTQLVRDLKTYGKVPALA